MQYLLMICGNETEFDKMSSGEQVALHDEYGKLIQELSAQGKFLGGNQLKPTTTATTVRVREGKRVVTDGPFVETKEQLGGYFLVNANDLDEAIAIAARIPSARMGTIEVRPVVMREQAARP